MAYLLRLASDMDMGGMDMTGFRMIPAGIAIMAPVPWRLEFLTYKILLPLLPKKHFQRSFLRSTPGNWSIPIQSYRVAFIALRN